MRRAAGLRVGLLLEAGLQPEVVVLVVEMAQPGVPAEGSAWLRANR